LTNKQKILAAIAGVLILIAGIAGASYLVTKNDKVVYGVSNPNLGLNITTYTGTYDSDTQYLGKCAVVTPPGSDPCDAAQGTLKYSFWGSTVNASTFQNWKKANPGEWARMCSGPIAADKSQTCLTGHMATPMCSVGPVGQPQDMITKYGAALYAETSAYACALGVGPINLPAPNAPPLAGAKDKTPPTAPGPITAQTQPLTTTTP